MENVNETNQVVNEEPKVVAAYTVFRYSNGNTVVDNAEVEGASPLTVEEIFADLKRVNRQITDKEELDRISRVVNAAVINAMNDVLTAAANRERVEEVEQAMPTMTPPADAE